MGPFTGLRIYALLGGALLLMLLSVGIMLHLKADTRVRGELKTVKGQVEQVVLATQHASGNPDVTWQTVPGQIVALGESNRVLLSEIEQVNRTVDDMAREAVRLRARGDELEKIAAKARAQRASALTALSDLRNTPGTRGDCMQLLREAEDALNIVREASRVQAIR